MATLFISTLVRVTAILACVLIAHRLVAARSAATRHRVLALGLLASPIALFGAVVPPWIVLEKPASWGDAGTTSASPIAIAVEQAAANPAEQVRSESITSRSITSRSNAAETIPAEMFATLAVAAEASELANDASPLRAATPTSDRNTANASGDPSSITQGSIEQGLVAQGLVAQGLVDERAAAQPLAFTWTSFLSIVWIAGSLFFLARIIAAWWLARAQFHRTRPADDDEVNRFRRSAPRFDNRNVDLRIALAPGQMPICMKVGGRGSVIVLPSESADWTENRFKSVVNHELAHAIRGDVWINLFAELQLALLWFHPLVRPVNRKLRLDAEIACDDWAIAQGVSRSEYARTILDMAARFRSRPCAWSIPMAARASMLDRRIQSALSSTNRHVGSTKRDATLLLAIACLFTLIVMSSWVQLVAAPPMTPTRTALDSGEANSTVNEVAVGEVAASEVAVSETNADETAIVTAVNLGNWLLLEPWLFDIVDRELPDQASLMRLWVDRFGQSRTDQLMETYRQNWITLSDLQAARSMGFNAVRLPFDCRLLESSDQPKQLRPDAFRWLDHAVSLCDQAGLAVILDLHGAPGGQSLDGPSGDSTSNRLWTDADSQDRTVWLWQRIADRYKNNDAVIAYDVINEPYGDFQQDLRASMSGLFSRLYDSIRAVDPLTLIYAPATLDGFAFYGDPVTNRWQHVGFTQHAYPGLFDGRPVAVRSHDMFLKHWVEPVDRMVDAMNVPFLLGEYNVVFEDAGGAALTAWYAQEYHRRGWSTAIWTLKRLLRQPSSEVNSWSLLTNSVGLSVDPRTDSYEELESKFKQIGQIGWDSQRKFADAIAGHSAGWQWTGRDPWQELDIDGDISSPAIARDSNWVIEAAGRDIFGVKDRFYFRCRPGTDDFQAAGRVLWIDETSPWAKAGWMIRADASADAPHLFIHATPDGQVMLCGRDRVGGDSWQQVVGLGSLPVRLGIKRSGDEVHFAWTDASGKPKRRSFAPDFVKNNPNTLVGVAVCSLAPGIKTTVGLDEVKFSSPHQRQTIVDLTDWKSPVQTLVTANTPDESAITDGDSSDWKIVPVANGSFETKADGGGDDVAEGWNRWGDWINRETGWMPVHSGSAIIGYHHFRIESDADSGLWQNVPVTANAPLRFRLRANVDLGNSNASPPQSVELRIETPNGDGTPVTVASKSYRAAEIKTGDDWSTLEVSGTPNVGMARLVVRVIPADGADVRRDGSLKFDDVEVSQQTSAIAVPTKNPSSESTAPEFALSNGSFEQPGSNGEAAGWSRWGSWLGRQDSWTPVHDGKAIMAYEHYQATGGDTSGIWQDIDVPKGAKVKFSVHANVDFGRTGGEPPRHLELKLESPQPDGAMMTLAKKTFEAKHIARDQEWSRLSIEATTLAEKVRCLVIVVPSERSDGRDGALKLDDADVSVTLE